MVLWIDIPHGEVCFGQHRFNPSNTKKTEHRNFGTCQLRKNCMKKNAWIQKTHDKNWRQRTQKNMTVQQNTEVWSSKCNLDVLIVKLWPDCMTAGMKAFRKAAEVPRKLCTMDGLSLLSANIDFAVHSSCMDYSVASVGSIASGRHSSYRRSQAEILSRRCHCVHGHSESHLSTVWYCDFKPFM